MAFVDLEKAFDHVPWKVIWWTLRKLGVEEWLVRLVQRMYAYTDRFFYPTLTQIMDSFSSSPLFLFIYFE